MADEFRDALGVACDKIADWLNKKIDIPYVPEFVEKLIFNKAVRWVADSIINTLKKLGGKNVRP